MKIKRLEKQNNPLFVYPDCMNPYSKNSWFRRNKRLSQQQKMEAQLEEQAELLKQQKAELQQQKVERQQLQQQKEVLAAKVEGYKESQEQLKHQIDQQIAELKEEVKQKKPSPSKSFTSLEIFTGIITLLGALIAALEFYQISQQTELIANQNTLVNQQVELIESERKSDLIILMSNIMDKIDEELEGKENRKDRILSKETISRIVALSYSLKPYRYYQDSTLIERPLSPERGQLLLALANLDLNAKTYADIYSRASFKSADLKEAPMDSLYLKGANLVRADLVGAFLNKAELNQAKLSDANLSGAYLIEGNLSEADLKDSRLNNALLYGVNLSKADLRGAVLNSGMKLVGADLIDADLRGVNLKGIDLSGANLSRAVLSVADLSGSVMNTGFLGGTNRDEWYPCHTILDSVKLNPYMNDTLNTVSLDTFKYYYRLSTRKHMNIHHGTFNYLLPNYPDLLQKRRKEWRKKQWWKIPVK